MPLVVLVERPGPETTGVSVHQALKVSLALTAVLSAGCSTYSSNIRVGNDMSYASLDAQRNASRTVQVLTDAPDGARSLGEVDAGRCHRSFTETAPTRESVLLDLKISAYARGADAITDVEIKKVSALTKDCWYMLDGKAKAIRLQQVHH